MTKENAPGPSPGDEKKKPEPSKKPPPPSNKREVPPELRAEIVSLHQFYGGREIARRVGLSRKIVRRVLHEEGHSTPPRSAAERARKLDPFRAAIEERVRKGLTVTRILREIRGPDPKTGYRGGRTILAEYVRALRARLAPESPKKGAKRRFETRPAEELQVDWSPYLVRIGGKLTRVHCLGCLLCHSRKLFVYFFADERQTTLFEGLAMAFEYFEGVTKRVVVDRMTQAVLGTIGANGKALWHPRFIDFLRYYGVKEPFACKVKDPNRKGKKEKSFRLVEDDFLRGAEFTSWTHLNGVERPFWLDGKPLVCNNRVHGTTGRVPNEVWLEERPLLVRLPEARFPVHEDDVRLVDQDATLSIKGTRYSVPMDLASMAVPVRLFAHHFEVLDRLGRVVFSRPYAEGKERGRLQLDPSHYPPPRRTTREGGRVEDRFLARFPSLAPFVEGLKLRVKALAPIHLRALLRLADRWGEALFLAGVGRALEYRRYDARAVERILERDHPLPDGDLDLPLLGDAAGTALLGEVEPPTLDDYGHLDRDPPTDTGRGVDEEKPHGPE